MEDLAGLLGLAALVGGWWWFNRFAKRKNVQQTWLRLLGGASVGFLAMMIVTAIFMPEQSPELAVATTDAAPASSAQQPREPLLDEVHPSLAKAFPSDNVEVKDGVVSVRLANLDEITDQMIMDARILSFCAPHWDTDEADGSKDGQPWTGVRAFRLLNASGSQGLEFSGGVAECEALGKLTNDDAKAYTAARTKPFGKLRAEEVEANCRKDLRCWAEKHSVSASVTCDDFVERLGQYSSRWTDGMLEQKFSHYRWADKDAGVVTYIGDKIDFQNGFGAFQPHVYECDYSTVAEAVVDVRAQPGRL
jgi:hypothetical protein